MSFWSNVNITVTTSATCSKAEFLNVFERVYKNFIGSEGGVTLNFVDGNVKTTNLKDYQIKKGNNGIKLTNYNELTHVIIYGALRDKDNVKEMAEDFKYIYGVLKEHYLVKNIQGEISNDIGERYLLQGSNCDIINIGN